MDDDKNLQDMYTTLFPFKNIDIVAQAYDGIQAIDMYCEMDSKPDIILMDQRMPRMDGITATKQLIEIDPEAKIIFLSADEALRPRAIKAGALVFLAKPISMNILIESITNLLTPI